MKQFPVLEIDETCICVLQEEIEVKKDTERADEIRALKKAWEDADPGRAAKVGFDLVRSLFLVSVTI